MNFICSNYRLSNFNKKESLVYQDFNRTEFQLVCLPPHYPLLISNFFPPAKKKKTLNKSHCTRPLVISSLTLYAHEFLQTLPRGQSETPDFPKNKYPRPGPFETSDGPNLLGWLLHTWTARADLSTRRLRILNPRLWSRIP